MVGAVGAAQCCGGEEGGGEEGGGEEGGRLQSAMADIRRGCVQAMR